MQPRIIPPTNIRGRIFADGYSEQKRDDIVVVAAAGDYGKPRPAVIVQTDAFPETVGSVVICQMTSDTVDAPDCRITIEHSAAEHSAALSVRSIFSSSNRYAATTGESAQPNRGVPVIEIGL
jgi:PemK-like, MazF-like toxin of type II toxin-antitoxin system